MTPMETLLSSALDALTAAIEAMEANGERLRPRLLRHARELVVAVALDMPAGRPRRWWEVWKR